MSIAKHIEKLGEIFNKLNHGIEIEYLDLKEKEFLCKCYGEDWKVKVLELLAKGKIYDR